MTTLVTTYVVLLFFSAFVCAWLGARIARKSRGEVRDVGTPRTT